MLTVPNQTNWAAKYRPQKLEDMVLPAPFLKQLTKLRDSQISLHLLFHGHAGTGKTTAARLINSDGNMEFNCSLNNSVRHIEIIDGLCGPRMVYEGLRIVILDEADNLTLAAQAALRHVIEKHSANNLFVLTANDKSKLIDPIHSRLHSVNFSHLKGNTEIFDAMVKRAMEVLKNEDVIISQEIVTTIVRESYPDMRNVIKRLQVESLLH